MNNVERIIRARHDLVENQPTLTRASDAAEGGCGVLGLASNMPVPGRHVMSASLQMNNRGNGKGGGVAMAGLDPEQMRVDAETLKTHYLLQIALLDPSARDDVEREFITPYLDVAQGYEVSHLDDFREVDRLDVRPPDVWRYFVRVKPDVLEQFASENDLGTLEPRALEDEFVYQNSFRLNQAYYASLGEKRAFVLSHGRDLIVLKIVGFAEQVVEYYQLHDQTAHVWIAHQRYPTKGRVWHPGGAHPFIGMNEALVHNGDFANYHAVSEYLRQRNMVPLFLTDTEVGALQFDLFDRVYRYPLEVTLEAMAPTTEHDFAMLPPEKQALYQAVQATHIHGSPDGPWFFIVARSKPDENRSELIGITDTSMLRPQVFAMYENDSPAEGSPVQIGLIASERQAINACLRSLSAEDDRFQPTADTYWVARGGSYTDGGAFRFSFTTDDGLVCTNKFGEPVQVNSGRKHASRATINPEAASDEFRSNWHDQSCLAYDNGGAPSMWDWLRPELKEMSWDELAWGMNWLVEFSRRGDDEWQFSLESLTMLRDQPFDPGKKRKASLLALTDSQIVSLLDNTPPINTSNGSALSKAFRLTWETQQALRAPESDGMWLVIDTTGYPAEGDDSAAQMIVKAYQKGWRRIIAYNWRGGRFAGTGIGPDTNGLRIDLYGDIGDYTASGLDGAEVHVHGAGQDQFAQIMRSGKLVIHGDVGQTFLYGAKGGDIYVRGSAAGRPLINAVGKPRAVINGTCLDYLAESFMAGDPMNGGGFVILNGITLDETGEIADLPSPYPGGNLFSLASGGAIYIRDPHEIVANEQLNGGDFARLTDEDWALIKPYLEENERLFDIRIEALLTVDGIRREPADVYRKVRISEANAVLVEKENR